MNKFSHVFSVEEVGSAVFKLSVSWVFETAGEEVDDAEDWGDIFGKILRLMTIFCSVGLPWGLQR